MCEHEQLDDFTVAVACTTQSMIFHTAFVTLCGCRVHLDQRSFPMTPEEYLDKLDGISMLLNVWDRQAYVRDFFRQKPTPKNGMPPRPIVGTAVALQLDLPPDQVKEWIGARLG